MRIRTMLLTSCLASLILSGTIDPVRAADRTITLASLLEEMIDRDAAARFPDPAYTCRQASSYDRASVSPDESETWMANNDRSFFIREEEVGGREESVMMDAQGPGCVVRFWASSGNPVGNIRVYLDGSKEPVINEPAKDLIGGDALVGPPLSEVRARGMNLYLPIPYAKRCVITYDRPNFHASRNKDDLLYYQINYRTYEAGAKVESFTRRSLQAAREQIAALEETLLAPASAVSDEETGGGGSAGTLKSGDHFQAEFEGTGNTAIRTLKVAITEADDLAAATRSIVLSIEFDGDETVWCPVGDFFGSGVGVNPYRGWWRTVKDDAMMTCYWPMPFDKSCVVRLINLGQRDVRAALIVSLQSWKWDARSMHFHANWRQEYPIDTTKKHDWNYLEASGKGVYMGDTLALVNPSPIWWGEGDEKIYVDGERFPSHFGTGTEDYYGYAWCTPEFFCSPFHSQPLAGGPRNSGQVTNTRVRLLDGIPFRKSFRMDMEVWHWRAVEVAYAATTYWYALPGASGNWGPAPEATKVYRLEPPKPPKVKGAIEGETLKILERTGGTTTVQSGSQFNWSDHKQLWWREGKPGDKLVLELPVASAGKYRLVANLTKAIDYGIVQLSLDGEPLGEPIDLINDGVIHKVFPLGTHQLTAGAHQLVVEIVGINPKAVKRYMFGLDYLKLDPAD